MLLHCHTMAADLQKEEEFNKVINRELKYGKV
jgi:hypothetical protein